MPGLPRSGEHRHHAHEFCTTQHAAYAPSMMQAPERASSRAQDPVLNRTVRTVLQVPDKGCNAFPFQQQSSHQEAATAMKMCSCRHIQDGLPLLELLFSVLSD